MIFKIFKNFHFLSFFSPPGDDLNANFYLAQNLQTSKSFRLAYFSKRAIPGNTIKSKFERMSLLQFLISNPQLYRYVADLVFQNFPDTVLLFELGCAHPALRVIEASGAQKTTSVKNRPVIIFLSSDVRPWYQVSTSTEAINMKFLPDGTIYSKSYPRK